MNDWIVFSTVPASVSDERKVDWDISGDSRTVEGEVEVDDGSGTASSGENGASLGESWGVGLS